MNIFVITKWYKSDGKYVEKGEAICAIAGEEASMDMEAPQAGNGMRATILFVMLPFLLSQLISGCGRSFYRDKQGLPHGTGSEIFHYPNGQVRVRSDFADGVPTKTTWLKPDGTVVATTEWKDGRGTGYIQRDDGTILASGPCADELSDGVWTYYKVDGSVEKHVTYSKGQLVKD